MRERDRERPELRFKGFEKKYEKSLIKDACSITTGKSNTQDQVDDGEYPFFIRSDTPVRSNRYLFDEEAVITIGDGNIGKVFHYIKGKFDLHQRCYKMSNFNNVSAIYFYYVFSKNFYERAMTMTAKATVDSVRLEMISDMEMMLPSSIKEQQKIGEFFKNLDQLIKSNQNKLDKLKDIKNGLLDRMLPRLGNDIPELRFSGYSKNWNLKKLNDILNIFSGEFVHSKYQNDIYDFPVYNGACTYTGFYKYFNQNGCKIVMSSRGINAGFVILENNKFWAGNSAFSMNVNSGHITSFVYFYLKSKYTEIQELINNSAIPAILLNDILRFQIYIPTKEEQQKIANFFIQLDNLISLQSKKVQKLKDIKNGYLNKMFVN
ncbi:hypothetical protein JM47_00190 [Ureaplasma diversum]|uniref:Type I restriction modification DNA specificity domain-containing protein n=1 Tax=Ureaplasma diversum TaxID=42094 RepID=A0A0C5RLS3_9BACT|nr:hypothetical protein JM47_00190 [Ureaplasma diversum]